MKYRLIKRTKASGFVEYVVQKKFLWGWEYVYSHYTERNARNTLQALMNGVPENKEEIIIETNQ